MLNTHEAMLELAGDKADLFRRIGARPAKLIEAVAKEAGYMDVESYSAWMQLASLALAALPEGFEITTRSTVPDAETGQLYVTELAESMSSRVRTGDVASIVTTCLACAAQAEED